MSVPFRGNYLGGRFIRPKKGNELISEDPGDLFDPVGRMVVSEEAVDVAVAAALKAFPKWSGLSLPQRIGKMKAFRREMVRRQSALAILVAREAGKPITESNREVDRLIAKVEETIVAGLKLVRPFSVEVDRGVKGECVWRPLGVLAVIGPFNFPAHTPASHLVPALLLGNTVVFKPSEFTPFVGQMIAECFDAAGFPPGVFNLVQGGASVGVRLVAHHGVAGILFTGSTAAGQAIKKATLDSQKLLALEMGGKNAAIVLEDASLDLAAREIAQSAFSMAGQRCNATSRVILNRRIAKPFLDQFLPLVERVRIGYPLEPEVLMGPLISHDAVAKLQKYVKLAEEEGFEMIRPGKATGLWGKRRGYYATPSVHLCERPEKNHSAHYRKEEIFGPNVAVYLVKDEEQAVALNNEVPYGLITSVFTRNPARFRKLFPKIDTGMVNLNRGTIFSSGKLPFGGTKASGSFRPAGLFSPYYCAYPVAVLQDSRPLADRRLPF
ncbi:MAG: aldehyde dehydrogenase family protein [Candidatus Omnitrophota bacterium]|nr:aldehyde dehydrogenase family protein [Candidatus Omnitrophota bacterium]